MKIEKTDKSSVVPNGGFAVLDQDNKLVAYMKTAPANAQDGDFGHKWIWDWIRYDRQ